MERNEKIAKVSKHYESMGHRVLPEVGPLQVAPSPVTGGGDVVSSIFQVTIKVIETDVDPPQVKFIFPGWASGDTLNEARDLAWHDALDQALARFKGD